MKDMIKIIFMITVLIVVYVYKTNISNFITEEIIYRGSNKMLTYNEYFLDSNFLYVQNIDSKSVSNHQELLNMFYTIINSGDDSFSFQCRYDNCISDVKVLTSDDDETIATINSFVHPFNSFETININVSNSGRVTVKPKKNYTPAQIQYIEDYIDNFISKNINNTMSDYDKIKKFHDYIIENTKYEDNETDKSYNAYYLIKNGRAICSGYSDIMAIYLNKLGILNYRITSENHIWNLVNLNGKWLHIDTTWDDPVVSDGKQYLIHNFFLITTEELQKVDKVEHNFDKNIYPEAK